MKPQQNQKPLQEKLDNLLVEEVKDYAIYLLDLEGYVSSWNVGAERIKGYQSAEIIGKHFSRFYTGDDQRKGRPAYNLKQALEHGRFEEETWRVRKDGSLFWADVVITPLHDRAGTLIGFSKITRDLTGRKEVEERLKRSQKQLAGAQKIAHLGSWEWEISSERLTWSEELYRIHGLSPWEEIDYPRFLRCLHPDDLPFIKKLIEETLRSGRPFSLDHRIVRPDGTVRILHSQGEVLLDERGEPIRIIGIGQDITERKEAENEVRKLNEELERRVAERTAELQAVNEALKQRTKEAEEASRLKSQFVSNVSHELRTPLNAIIGYTQLIREEVYGAVQEAQRPALNGIRRNADELLNLINDMLDLAKVEAGKMTLELSEVDLGLLLEEAVAGIRSIAGSLSIRCVIEPGLSRIESDEGKIKQIMVNLLSNAVKFTPEGGITVSGRMGTDRSGIELTVNDTGIGIRSEELPRIFDMFHQVDGGSTRRFGGVGLGLAIVKDLLRLLGGEIRVESEYGKGSTFTVFLPVRFHG